ncbi:MAG: GNAT family N-acetyltransferase [Thermoplasmata archaeon]
MILGMSGEEMETLAFSDEWIEGLLDLEEQDDAKDPLYPATTTREQRKTMIMRQISSEVTKAHRIAVHEGNVVASAKANVVPTCGTTDSTEAWFSLVVSPSYRRKGLGSRLLEAVSNDLIAQNVQLLRIGVLDSWIGWRAFLDKVGFEPGKKLGDRTVDLVLRFSVSPIAVQTLPNVNVRPIRLPEEVGKVTDFFNQEFARDFPGGCLLTLEYWTVGPGSQIDPRGFFVAEERDTGRIVGCVVGEVASDKEDLEGKVEFHVVSSDFLDTALMEQLLLQVIEWLRAKGVKDIRTRSYIGLRQEKILRKVGFVIESSGTVWYKPTSA